MNWRQTFILGCALALSGCTPSAVGRAWKRIHAGDLPGARRTVLVGLHRHPTSLDLWVMRLRVGLLGKDFKDAGLSYLKIRKRASRRERRRATDMLVAQTLWIALGTPRFKLRAVRLARDMRLPGLEDRIEPLLDDPNPLVRVLAAGALRKKNKTARHLIRSLAFHASPAVRREAVAFVPPPWDQEAWRILTKLLSDPDPEVRRAAAAVCGHAKGHENRAHAVSLLIEVLSDPVGMVRAEAASTLRRWRRSGSWMLLARTDPHLGVRLASVGSSPKDLRVVMQGSDPYLALRAAVRLWNRGDHRSDQVLVRWARDRQWSVRAALCNAAGSMRGSSVAKKVVRSLLTDPHPWVRLSACEAAFHLKVARRLARTTARALAQRPADATAVEAAAVLARWDNDQSILEAMASKVGPWQISAIRHLGPFRSSVGAVVDAWAKGPWPVRLVAAEVLRRHMR
ncbi:MAG: HEAT repeat domain-containing protein [Deltaproteobacteria bacterium]|nr:HEAT repeat domain-containing protein [Deltaproteobacteria bacterium]